MKYFLQGQLLTSGELNQNFKETINASGNYFITGMYNHVNNIYLTSVNTSVYFENPVGTGYIGSVRGSGNAVFLHFGTNTNIIANGASGQFLYLLTGDNNRPGSLYWDTLENLIGYVGTAGLKGDRGYTGSRSTYIGYSGSPGVNYTGSAGATGPTGPTGYQGSVGATGYMGPTGPGPAGPAGPQGDPGATGATGPAGTPGGATGIQGPQGDPGATGATGATGYTGSKSLVPGYVGSPGGIGETGYKGSSGDQGDYGETGYTGSVGFFGSKGYFGSTGYRGSAGIGNGELLKGVAGDTEVLWNDMGIVNSDSKFTYTKYDPGNPDTAILTVSPQSGGGVPVKIGLSKVRVNIGNANSVLSSNSLYIQTSDDDNPSAMFATKNMYIYNDKLKVMNLTHFGYLNNANLNLTGDIRLIKSAVPLEYQTSPSDTTGITRNLTLGGQRYQITKDFARIDFVNYDTGSNGLDYVGARISSQNEYTNTPGDAGDLRFWTGDIAFINVHFYIAANGNVGVNNLKPDASLVVGSKTPTSDKSTWGTMNVHGKAIFTKNTHTYGIAFHYEDVEMNNYAINHVDRVLFNDPGFQEGVIWQDGHEWGIFETVDDYTDITNVAGDLQIAYNTLFINGGGGVRHSAFRYPDANNAYGKLDVVGNVVVGYELWVGDRITADRNYTRSSMTIGESNPDGANLYLKGNANLHGNVWISGTFTSGGTGAPGANSQLLYNTNGLVGALNNVYYKTDMPSDWLVVNSSIDILNDLYVRSDAFIYGNLVVLGTTTSIDTQTLQVNDNIIIIARDNNTDMLDFGFVGAYQNSVGGNVYSGLFRRNNDKKYYVVGQYDTTPGANININDTSFELATLVAKSFEGEFTGISNLANFANVASYANNSGYLGSISANQYFLKYESNTLTGNVTFGGANVNVLNTLTVNDLFVTGIMPPASFSSANFTANGALSHKGLQYTIGTNVDQVITRTDTLIVTPNWQSTTVNNALLVTGSYYIQMTSDVNELYSGIMSWKTGDISGYVEEDIILHKGHSGTSPDYVYLRVYAGPTTNTALQISSDTTRTSMDYSFKIRRIL